MQKNNLSNGTRNDWTREEISEIYNQPVMDLMYQAATVHRQFNDAQEVQVCTLLSVKTGGCPEDCAYCPQAARYHTDVKVHKLMEVSEVINKAIEAKESGSTRFGPYLRRAPRPVSPSVRCGARSRLDCGGG